MGRRGARGNRKNNREKRNLARECARPVDEQVKRLEKAIQKSRKLNRALALSPWRQSRDSAASAADTAPPHTEEKEVTPAGVTRVSVESDSESGHALSHSSEVPETCIAEEIEEEDFPLVPASQAEEPSQRLLALP